MSADWRPPRPVVASQSRPPATRRRSRRVTGRAHRRADPPSVIDLEAVMPEWDATTYEAKDTLLRVVRREAERFFALVQVPDAWNAPTACPQWQVRDIVGHLIDVTESYFTGFDAARGGREHPEALGVRAMQRLLDEGARTHRELGQAEAVERLHGDFAKLMEMCEALGPDEWGGPGVPHQDKGPL